MTPEQIPSKDRLSNCEICGGEMDDLIVILPIEQPDGCYDTFACLNCAEKSRVYCLTHERPHIGFEDGTTACLVCIEEKIVEDGPRAIIDFFQGIEDSPHKEEILQGLEKWSDLLSEEFGLDNQGENVARVIITAAVRHKKSTQEIITQVSREGLDVILPFSVRQSIG
jgi:hypothetical protein